MPKTPPTWSLLVVWFAFAAHLASAAPLENRAAGSATTLEGSVYAISVFVSTPDAPWDDAAKDRMLARQEIAESWLVRQATEYDVALSFDHGTLGRTSDIVLKHIVQGYGSGDEPVDVVSRILRQAGYSNPSALHGWAARYKQCDHVVVLLYANLTGIGYSMAFAPEMDHDLYFLEGTMLYRAYPGGSEMAAASIAHEILHLFGAWDLYETFEQTEDRARKATQLFTDDIMRRTSYDIEELEVGGLTAWRVGWHDEPESYFEWFRTPGGQYGPVPP